MGASDDIMDGYFIGMGRVQTLQAMANDPELNIRNNIGMRETQFFHMFLQKTL